MTVILFALAGVFLVAYLIRRRARLNWLRGTTTTTNQMLNLILKSTALANGQHQPRCGRSQSVFDGSPRGPAQSRTVSPQGSWTVV